MSDWKGKRVQLTANKMSNLSLAFEIYKDGPIYLDTDTMSDIFEKYDPSEYMIMIEPYEGDEEE